MNTETCCNLDIKVIFLLLNFFLVLPKKMVILCSISDLGDNKFFAAWNFDSFIIKIGCFS